MPALGRLLYPTDLVGFSSRSLQTVDSFQQVEKGHRHARINGGYGSSYEKHIFETS